MKPVVLALLGIALLIAPGVLLAGTIFVDDDAPGDPGPGDPIVSDPLEDGSAAHPFDAIQEGIDAAVGGDTVLVLDGTYTGTGNRDISFGGKAITVASENGADTCIIDCQGIETDAHRGFQFQTGETSASVVEGFTILGGYAQEGGGVYIDGSDPTIAGCVITECTGTSHGGGIYAEYGSSVSIVECTITNNAAGNRGGGIYLRGGEVRRCTITGNVAGGMGGGIFCWLSYGTPQVSNCVIADNTAHEGGAIACYYCSAAVSFVHCTVVGNLATERGGGFFSTQSTSSLENSIIHANEPDSIREYDGTFTVSYSNIEKGWPGAENIDLDPGLTTGWHVVGDSPCVDWCPTGDVLDFEGEPRPIDVPGVGYDDPPDARTFDMGADEFLDWDGDGLPVWWEDEYYGDAGGDPDGDGLTNLDEFEWGCDPDIQDSDDDGRLDGAEVTGGTNPIHPDNVEKTYYVNGLTGNDTYDGLAKVWDGTHGPKQTIGAGMAAAISRWGYTVEVAAGAYAGAGNRDLDFLGKDITVRSEEGPEITVIDCQGTPEENHRAFVFMLREEADSVLEGFTMVNGYHDEKGGAIYGHWFVAPTLRDCVIKDCAAGSKGGGIYFYGITDPTMERCTVEGNTAVLGGGIHLEAGGRLTHCRIIGNHAQFEGGGIRFAWPETLLLENCLIAGNTSDDRGGGVAGWQSDAVLANCTIVGNSAEDEAGGLYASLSAVVGVINCIVWDNTPEQIAVTSTTLTVTYSDVMGSWPGTGNIDTDPLSVGGPLHGYYLSQVAAGQGTDSPCVDAGSDTAAALGLDGLTTRVDGGRDVGTVDMGYHAAPAPFITSIARSGDDVVIEWNGLAGMPYALAWTDEWWSEAATWSEVAVGAVETWTDVGVVAGMPVGTMRRYCVREDGAPPAPSPMVEPVSDSLSTGPVSTGNGKRVPGGSLHGSSSRDPVRGGPNVRGGGNVRGRAGNVSEN